MIDIRIVSKELWPVVLLRRNSNIGFSVSYSCDSIFCYFSMEVSAFHIQVAKKTAI